MPHLGRGAGADLRGEREWVGLLDPLAAGVRGERVLVVRAVLDPGDEALPDAGVGGGREPERAGLPLVEVAEHRDLARVRAPHRKVRAPQAVWPHRISAEPLPGTQAGAFV